MWRLYYFRAWLLGVRAGLAEPVELTFGLTWDDDQGMNESFDRGVNWGQRAGRLLGRGA